MARYLDLTHPLVHGSPAFPGDPLLSIRPHATVAADGWNVSSLQMGTHQGTHLDAPRHIYQTGRTVDALPLHQLCGPAVFIDLAPGGTLEPHARIPLDSFKLHARRLRPGARLIYRTGWERYFGRPQFFYGFPSLTDEATEWLASRRLALLGMDTPSPAESPEFAHRALLAPDVQTIIVESLANLALLPARFELLVLPLKLKGLDGSPARAIARVG